MRFLRRGGDSRGGTLEERLTEFWAWWAGAKDGIAADIEAGRVAGRASEISRAVDAVQSGLAWELGQGKAARHMFCVSPEGNAEIRPVAIRWTASAPAPDAVWEYWGSRQPGENGAIDIGGGRVDYEVMRAVTSWDETRERLAIRLWHPAFEGLPDDARHRIAFLFLDNLVGEDEVERWMGELDIDPSAQAGRTPDELRDELHRRAESATGSTWALLEGTDAQGNPVIVRLNASLKRIDHPFADRHLQISIERGLEHGDEPGLNASIATAEEELEGLLGDTAIEAAHVTDRRRRLTHYVCENDAPLPIAQAWAERYRHWGAKATLQADAHWSFRRTYGE